MPYRYVKPFWSGFIKGIVVLVQLISPWKISPSASARKWLGYLSILFTFALASPALTEPKTCGPTWYSANLTNYESYPAPGSEECVKYNGCAWVGQFYGLNGTYSEEWVAEHNIVAIHLKDWDWLGMKVLRLRKGDRMLMVQAIDACNDADCDGCCTANLGGDGYLIDVEKYTLARLGAGSGAVDFQVCE